MKPVAAYSRLKPGLLAAFELPVGLAALAVALLLVPYFVWTEVVQREGGSWALLLIGIMPLGIGAIAFSSGARMLRAALEKDCVLEGGPDAFRFKLPGEALKSKWWLGYELVDRRVRWADVAKWYPFVRRVNGIPMSRAIVFELRSGETLMLEGVYLAGGVEAAMDALDSTRQGR